MMFKANETIVIREGSQIHILPINSKHVNICTVIEGTVSTLWIKYLKIEINARYLRTLYLILISTEMNLKLFKQTEYLSEIRETWSIQRSLKLQSSKYSQGSNI